MANGYRRPLIGAGRASQRREARRQRVEDNGGGRRSIDTILPAQAKISKSKGRSHGRRGPATCCPIRPLQDTCLELCWGFLARYTLPSVGQAARTPVPIALLRLAAARTDVNRLRPGAFARWRRCLAGTRLLREAAWKSCRNAPGGIDCPRRLGGVCTFSYRSHP